MPGAMAEVARPGIIAWIGHHRGPQRVGLDVPQDDEQVVAVLDDGGSKAALPDVAAGPSLRWCRQVCATVRDWRIRLIDWPGAGLSNR